MINMFVSFKTSKSKKTETLVTVFKNSLFSYSRVLEWTVIKVLSVFSDLLFFKLSINDPC